MKGSADLNVLIHKETVPLAEPVTLRVTGRLRLGVGTGSCQWLGRLCASPQASFKFKLFAVSTGMKALAGP